MAVPGELHELVERFDRDHETYRSRDYNEAQARVDFINPLLELLGWDVNNGRGHPEAYRDVIYEDRVKVGGSTKAPDYGFYTPCPAARSVRFRGSTINPEKHFMRDVVP